MKKVKVALIGVGDISGIYLKNITHIFQEIELVGLCDLIPEKAQKGLKYIEDAIKEGAKVCKPVIYKDMYEAFNDPEVEVILNLTRPYEHYEVSKGAILAGKHVYSEKPLCGTLEEAEELLQLIRPYFITLLMTLPFTMLFNAFKQFFDGITKTKTPMWILLCGNMVNIVGNYLLIFGKCGMPELGLLGAGISTLIARMVMLAMIFAVFINKKEYKRFANGFFNGKITFTDIKLLNKIGLPVALQMGMETASFSLTTIMIGWIGTTSLAAHQIMVTVGQLGFMIYYGMAAAVAVKTSNYSGSGDNADIRRVAAAGFHIITVMAVMTSTLIFLLRNKIGGIFTDNTEVALLVSQLTIPFILYQIGDGMQCTYSNALRGITDVKPVMLFAFIAYFMISLPSGYIFGFILDFGLPGVWMSFPLGLTSAGIMFYLRFRSKVKAKINS